MNILIGGAWPYANGSLHLGHLAALLPGDVLARYHRKKGDSVLYVSGSDCHGTPISLRAKSENVDPFTITNKYHAEFVACFDNLGFSYDLYNRTDDDFHKDHIKAIINKIHEHGFIFEKEVEQLYCDTCEQFLSDRYIEGVCPNCKNIARGDQCDHCSSLLNPLDLINRVCKTCGAEPVVKTEKQLFFKLSAFQEELENLLHHNYKWRPNAIGATERYLNEGLVDRAISRDLPWGIDLPIKGYEDKKLYVWFEAVLGYLTASIKCAEQNNFNWEPFWTGDVKSYYVHGKDNIPFHAIILPALLLAINDLALPTQIVSSEYLTLEGKKISTSNNWAVWLPDIISRYNPDAIRYFMIANGPENRDTDFSWREFVNSNNGELLGAWGNLVNRTLVFVHKSFQGTIPNGKIDEAIESDLKSLYCDAGQLIEYAKFKDALDLIFNIIRKLNKYFDEQKPWITIKEDPLQCAATIYNCVNAIANFANLLEPFLPFSSDKVIHWLQIKREWKYLIVQSQIEISLPDILFARLDKKVVEEELSLLGH